MEWEWPGVRSEGDHASLCSKVYAMNEALFKMFSLSSSHIVYRVSYTVLAMVCCAV